MTTETKAPEETPATPQTAPDDKRFEMCGCNGKLHGYIVQSGKHFFPATIISMRAGRAVLDFLLEEKMISPEEKDAISGQMEAAGLPAEIGVDMDVAMASAARTMSPGGLALALLMGEMGRFHL